MLNELIKEIRKSVILVTTGSKVGTGFLISEDGLAVTCCHVVETASGGIVPGGIAGILDEKTVGYTLSEFTVKRTERCYDLALIKISGGPFEKLNLDDNFGDRIAGEDIAIFGFPFAPYLRHPSLTKGIISALFTDPRNNVDMIQTDTWIYEASSGSPCFLTNGIVVGYATSSFDPFAELMPQTGFEMKFGGKPLQDRTNICFVVPSKYILELLKSI